MKKVFEDMNSYPKVTVLIAAYNRLEFLKDSLASVFAQDIDSMEILVVDDGSDLETQRWLDKEATKRNDIRVIHQKNRGVAYARQIGLQKAHGEFVCILDSDDKLIPGAIGKIMHVFTNNPEVDLVYVNNIHIMPNNRIKYSPYPLFHGNTHMIHWTFLRPRVPFKHSGTTFRRNVAIALGGYDTELPIKIDIDMFLKFLSNKCRLFLIEEALVEYRMHKNSLSANRFLGIKIWWNLIDRYGPRQYLLKSIYKAVRTLIELFKYGYYQMIIKRAQW